MEVYKIEPKIQLKVLCAKKIWKANTCQTIAYAWYILLKWEAPQVLQITQFLYSTIHIFQGAF